SRSTSFAAASRPSRPRASSATCAPSRANRSTIARPTPLVAPVTTTTSGLLIVLHLFLRRGDERRRVDQRQVRETLREVAEELAARGVDLLRVEADVVRELEQLLHRLARLLDAADARERLDEPERAREERALLPLLAAVAVEEWAAGAERGADRVDRRARARVVRLQEAGADREQHRRVEFLGAGVERVAPLLRGPAAVVDPRTDLLRLLAPRVGTLARRLPLRRELQRPVERDPAVHLRDRVVTEVVELPDPGVLVLPDAADVVGDLGDADAGVLVERVAVAHVELDRLEQVAVRAELELAGGAVSLPHRLRTAIAAELELLRLARHRPVEGVEGLEPRMRRVARAQDPRQRGVHLLAVADGAERVESKRAVADPRVAVVVVPRAADLLRQRR